MTDRLIVTLVVCFLGIAACGSAAGAVVLKALGNDVPGELWQFGGVALGGLASLLASTRSAPPNPAPPAPPEV